MAKSAALNALDYLDSPPGDCPSVVVVYGDEAFLKREVLAALRRSVAGDQDEGFSLSTFAGKDAELRDIRDALSSVSLFGGGRPLAIVQEADPFVTRYRAELEAYVAKPAGGVLVLEVKTWAANTKLAKAVAAEGRAIECKPPRADRAKRWLAAWAKREHDVKLDAAAADALLDLVPLELGILQQEIARLALLAGDDRRITPSLVEEHVGGWRARTAWDMIDAVADGNAADALAQLARLISAGEQPIGVLAQMSSTLRKFALATHLIEEAETSGRRISLSAAIAQAGFPPFKVSAAERQLRQIGRARAKHLHEWLLSSDLALKGVNSTGPKARLELERLIVRLSKAGDPRRSSVAAG